MKKTGILAKIVSAVLTISAVLCFSSCGDTTWVYSSGDQSVPAGVYLGYLVDAYYGAVSGLTDKETDIFKQKIDGVKVADHIKDQAKLDCTSYVAIERLFDEYKLKLTEDEIEELNATVNSIWESAGSIYEENGCGKSSFYKMMENDEKQQKIFEYYYSENGKEPVSEKERKDFFTKNYAKIKYVAVTYSNHFKGVTTASDATDAQKKELKKIAEDYVARLAKGEKIDKISGEEQLAAHSVEAGSSHEGHDHSSYDKTEVDYTFITKDTSEEPDKFNAAVFKADYNKPSMAEYSTYGYYVYVRYETNADSKDYTDRASGVLSNMKSDDWTKILDKSISQVKLTANDAAVKRYKPQNIVLEY